MKRQNPLRRQLLVASLKSAVGTAAVVATIGGWMAFGSQQSDTTTAAAAVVLAPTAEASAAGISNDTAAPVAQAGVSGAAPSPTDVPTATEASDAIAPTAAPAAPTPTAPEVPTPTEPAPATDSGTTAPSSTSPSQSRRGPVTTTRSSR